VTVSPKEPVQQETSDSRQEAGAGVQSQLETATTTTDSHDGGDAIDGGGAIDAGVAIDGSSGGGN
jgi:hypothetical protein